MITQYRCDACKASSAVELVGADLARETPAVAELRARMRLAFATCPACGARNPEGVAEQRRDERNIMVLTIVVMVGLTIGAYFVPWIVLGWLGLFGALYLYFLAKRPTAGLVINLATTLGFGALAWWYPRWAFLIVAVPTVQMLIKRRDPAERDGPWQRAAEQLRFFDTAERRP